MKLYGSKNWKKERKEKYILIGLFLLLSIIAFPLLLPFYILFAFAGGSLWLISVVINSYEKNKIKKNINHNLKIKVEKNKKQACSIFGSCIIRNIKNTKSPGWLKNRILALGLRPISAVVDITNYVMFDLNRPLHAYDLDKIKNKITVRNSKKGENRA